MLKMAIHTIQSRINTELGDIAAKAAVTSNNTVQQLYGEHRPIADLHFSFCLLFKNLSALITAQQWLGIISICLKKKLKV